MASETKKLKQFLAILKGAGIKFKKDVELKEAKKLFKTWLEKGEELEELSKSDKALLEDLGFQVDPTEDDEKPAKGKKGKKPADDDEDDDSDEEESEDDDDSDDDDDDSDEEDEDEKPSKKKGKGKKSKDEEEDDDDDSDDSEDEDEEEESEDDDEDEKPSKKKGKKGLKEKGSGLKGAFDEFVKENKTFTHAALMKVASKQKGDGERWFKTYLKAALEEKDISYTAK